MRASRAWVCAVLIASAVLGQPRVELPEPDLAALEPTVAEQLEEMRSLAATVVHNLLAPLGDRVQAWGEMGRLFHAYQLLDAAETCYSQAESLDPDEAAWPHYRAHVALAAGDLERAASRLERALDLHADDLASLIHSADVARDRNRPEEAAAYLARAARIAPGAAVVAARSGEHRLAAGDYAAAVELLALAIEAEPAATRLHHPLGLAYRGLGDLDSARRHLALRGDVGLAPADPLMDELANLQVGERVHLLRGRKAFQAGRFADAANEFRAAVASKPDSVRAIVNLSAALSANGDRRGAKQQLARALRIDPGNPTARYNLAALLAADGDHLGAVEHYAAAAAADAEDEESWLGEARSWTALGEFGHLRDTLELAHAALPDSGRVAAALARVLSQAPDLAVRDGARALDLARRVFAAQPDVDHGLLVAAALRETGECAGARAWTEELLRQWAASLTEEGTRRLREEAMGIADDGACRP